MYETLIPKMCLWCSGSRVVNDRCLKCDTKYGEKIVRKEKKKDGVLHLGRKEITHLRNLRFRWEM